MSTSSSIIQLSLFNNTPSPMDLLKPTDFGSFIVEVLAQSSRESRPLDQRVLRQCLGLSSSFLITDTTMNAESGIHSWTIGFNRLIDIIVALHAINELEIETVNAASRACSECWSASGSWRGLEDCREAVRAVAAKLKKLLDSNGRTYRGQIIYTP